MNVIFWKRTPKKQKKRIKDGTKYKKETLIKKVKTDLKRNMFVYVNSIIQLQLQVTEELKISRKPTKRDKQTI